MGLADWGIRIGTLPSGPTGSVLDVPGVGLGHATVVHDEPAVARTGVTVIDPGGDLQESPVTAGVAVLNGAGELTSRSQIDEWGVAETPVFLTSTMQVGRVYDAACQILLEGKGDPEVLIPVVGECDDSWLNDVRRMHVTEEHVRAALDAARSSVGDDRPPQEGAVGAGTGMSCFSWKGGIGTASRVLPDGHVLAVLLLTNFGSWERLTVGGRLVGPELGPPPHVAPPPAGSCLGVVVTDAPVDHHGCERLARRVGLGLARTGSVATHGSGEIFVAVSTGLRGRTDVRGTVTPLPGRALDDCFTAVVDATEEAVVSSLLHATTTTGVGGAVIEALPADRLLGVLAGG